ncbi:MAG: hypothetical protein M0Q53_14805 [Prolixibacteraceae bacterium]|jgi:hypothetical protein|nr:hypothetical protein [Prolixibacteraceae bacterium]
MNHPCKIISFLALFVGILACNNNSPIKISEVDGHDFVSCNIDKIKNTYNLKLSEVAEYSEIVVLSNDPSLEDEDYNIQRTFVSDKYIIVMPWTRPALLYSRDGKFIKRLFSSDKVKNLLWGLYAQIDDENDKFYLLVAGLKLLIFNLHDNNVIYIPKATEYIWDFVLIDGDKIFATFENNQNIWALIQPIYAPKAEYLHGRVSNNLLNKISNSSGKILMWGNTIILSFSSANDTSYYYNPKNKTFSPFLRCFSPKNSIDLNKRIKNSPELLAVAETRLLTNNKLLHKRLFFVSDRYNLFSLHYGTNKYFIVDKHGEQAYFLNKIVNDFWGGLGMNYESMFSGWQYINNNDGYLTFNYSTAKLREEITKLNIDTLEEIGKNKLIKLNNKIKTDNCNVLFISKLKK